MREILGLLDRVQEELGMTQKMANADSILSEIGTDGLLGLGSGYVTLGLVFGYVTLLLTLNLMQKGSDST